MEQRTLTEKQILKKMGIPDFRHVTKDKIISFASLLPKMDKEVAMKALEQFPCFASASLDMIKNYKTILEKTIETVADSNRQTIDVYLNLMGNYEEILHQEKMSFDEQIYILNEMKDIAILIDKCENENKNTLRKIAGYGSVAIISVITILANVLGNDIDVPKSDDF